ncbi:bifunctional [glutamate--ammonia ligase]-adenylyl-L-tyrosine phosphorylase/[glutamate--ammonia-ligase] adenylyltransferase [Candidimonas sp. SYP-B2681]|uniref:bifunctional [glutamate--ammonia ligase]-adenylyl-L-tyrosine phosphorylase/[glutamate--ammonia-ligase] adenylyltransferase n=1 Tax=Candidimonas sp. SYP-B2681 TaxID=2497686 RepID=UPI000F888E71|nr:bifunctional [glutamate--ammonia ligase]-adenylyl-L-tyrosine phosphorylase/[glutamate--ammonia-ligase] adenylyltransferase [Candidimonas sp. SYP-B2681]RTZ41039.1 bifunctional [glutamate--ammonia ligase]-adenylyl-L-tyrosine phosphorylase/[glutamate--ammonia-ligase] adenylyltransferase [Candidimonas sp. SYP-B2681]
MSSAIILEPALRWSGALRRKLVANAPFGTWLADSATHAVTRQSVLLWFEELRQNNSDAPLSLPEVRRILRQLRSRVFYTLMVRDINGVAPLPEVIAAMSALADLAVAQAYKSVAVSLAEIHGVPIDHNTGRPQELLILGMGKLGGKELNVSSDIDLIMLYGEEGETTGKRKISHHEFYGRVTQRMMPVLSEMDADGQVFRTDLRLRPDGDSGPLAWSLDALENYLVTQGREWERYAWLKSRVIPCQAFPDSDSSGQLEQLEALRTPFVYRKYFDFDALAALRALRERIRQDWQRRAMARTGVDTVHNIKLGDGGIREIEFVVQLSQLIRGGRMPSLQQRALLSALYKQKQAGVIASDVADNLETAYCFLRRVEHLLQYREDEQTHLLPRDNDLRNGLAQAMGMPLAHFEARLSSHRAFVEKTFRDAFRIAGMGGDADNAACETDDVPDASCNLVEHINLHLGDKAPAICQRVDALLDSHRIRSLPETSRRRVETLLPAIVSMAATTDHPDQTAIRLLTLVENIAQRSAYLALLAEYPDTLARVSRIVSASPWASQYLSRFPLLLDSLIEWHSLMEPPDFGQIAQQLHSELDACMLPDGQPDIEQQMNIMRDTQHQITFQLLAQDLEGVLTVEHLADRLSALADMLLTETIYRVWPLVQGKNKRVDLAPPHFAIIAYGKLGGKEIGYASDLDLVFLYDDPSDDDASEIYAKLGRRMSSWLSTMTSSGRLYEIDLRLRPDGDAGLLAVSVDAFAQYQTTHAWPWEHQAITRARFVAGDIEIGNRFEKIRQQVLLLPRDPETFKDDVRSMRERISAGHPNRTSEFDLKHDRGGMVDVEFVTQYLVLCHARQFPVLLGNFGNIALLRLAAEAGLIPSDLASRVGNAYRELRKRQHALRLEGAEKARVPSDQLDSERAAVRELWNTVIGD